MPHLPGSPTWQRVGSHSQVLDYHLSMLLDAARMDSYRRAIDATVRPGDVVVDIGCGTGVLTFMACEAGAKRVYAIEGGPIIDVARELAVDNGFADRIEFVDGWSIDPRSSGTCPMCSSPRPSAMRVSTKASSPGPPMRVNDFCGPALRFFPSGSGYGVAAAESFDDHALVSDWWSAELPYNYAAAHRRAALTLWFADITPNNLLGQPALAADVDLRTARNETTAAAGLLQVDRDGTLHGLACWFDSLLCAGVTVDNTPPREDSSWSQGFLPLAEPIAVNAGDQLSWEISVSADGEQWTWHVDPSEQ